MRKPIITGIFMTILINLFTFMPINAQEDVLRKKIVLQNTAYTLTDLVDVLLSKNGINLSCNNNVLRKNVTIKFSKSEYSVQSLLNELSNQSDITYVVNEGIIVLKNKPIPVKYTVSGIIKDSLTGETIPYATISQMNSSIGTVTNKYGFYSLVVPQGNFQVVYSYLGYKAKIIQLAINKDIEQNIDLSPITYNINEVSVKYNNSLTVTDSKLTELNLKEIKELPNLFGESDILRNIQLLPGITGVVDFGGSFNVRGGNMDQNLFLLDEAIVYNASHLAGFYSIFNSDIIKDVKLYKANIPANYGGRLSSVMDVTQKEGNIKSFHLKGTLSTIACNLTVEGPIVKDKASFIISARRSYVDLFFGLAPKNIDTDLDNTKIHFFDVNAKINYRLNDKNRLYLSAYYGNDKLKIDNYNQEYGNLTTTLRYNHLFSNKLFSNTSVIYSNYKMIDGESSDITEWEDLIGLDHYQFKNEFNYYLYKNRLKFGFETIYRDFYPGELKQTNSETGSLNIKIQEQHVLESAIYLSNIVTLWKKLEIQLGIRYSVFHYLGPENIYNYQNDIPRDITTITDTVSYAKYEPIQVYDNWEPRISARYALNETNSIQLSYNKTAQYIHLVTNTVVPMPYNMWKPSNENIKPLTGEQFTLGYFGSFYDKTIEFAFETYYRNMKNTLEVKPGTDIVLNPALDADLLDGTGKAYGIELMINYEKGKNTVSLGYTYSRSLRKVNPFYAQYKLLPDDWYPSDYDMPQKITLVYSHKISARTTFTADFSYFSGRPVTLPDGQYIYFGTLLPYYSGKNQHRIPDFHKLDVSINVGCKKNEIRKWKGVWKFSLYNVYARNNAYSIYLHRIPRTFNTEAIKFSVIGTIVPSIAYSFSY